MNNDLNRSILQVENIIEIAKQCASLNRNTVMLSFIDEDSIPFVKNWLCNTYQIVVHKSVIFLTTSEPSVNMLKKYWPNANIVVMDISETEKG